MGAIIEEHPEVQVFDEISQIEHGVRMAISRALPVGLTYPQYEVLNLIARRGEDLTPNAIATALRMTPGAITNTLQRLEATSLVTVGTCEADRRRKRVRMTLAGREAYNRSMAAIRPKVEKLRDGFTEKEFREALPFLRALRVWMSELP
ncbi:MAG: MarR family transcriptional regulator [Phenylobacterium sp.]|uniref:MarR family winged helix-turn-helix transcriptional regulator n=1 Tax=Phenylobacterium sp. TaxID=1871053 RepID=UPI0025F03743|nr:MarR family transcriptional regulator [Phenylobacterium sp.]MBI1200719.1 MarR family transcriptional regulator [Phenylobacterium sp.]